MSLSEESTRQYDAVVAATGFAWHPRMPAYTGIFTGELIHSSQYRAASQLSGKRVLVIGAGNSGVDIACDAAHSAGARCCRCGAATSSSRKYILGKPADIFAKSARAAADTSSGSLFLPCCCADQRRRHQVRPRRKPSLPLSSHPIINYVRALLHMAQGDPRSQRRGRSNSFEGSDRCSGTARVKTIQIWLIAATGYVQQRCRSADPALLQINAGDKSGYCSCVRCRRRDPTFAAPGFLEDRQRRQPVL